MDYNQLSDADLIALSEGNYDALSDEALLVLSSEKEKEFSLGQKLTAGLKRAAETIPAYMDEELSRVAGNVLQKTGVIPPAPEGTQFHSTGAEQQAIKAAEQEHAAMQQSNLPTALASGLLGYAPAMPFAANPWTGFTGGAITGAAENRYRGRAFGMEDTENYETSGALFGGMNMALPASLAGGLGKRMLTGGAMGAGLGGTQALTENVLTEGYSELYQDPLLAAGIGGLVGGVVGGAFGHRAKMGKEDTAAPTPDVDPELVFKQQQELEQSFIARQREVEFQERQGTLDMPMERTKAQEFKERFGERRPDLVANELDQSLRKAEVQVASREKVIADLKEKEPANPRIATLEDLHQKQIGEIEKLKGDIALAKEADAELQHRQRPVETDSRNEIPAVGKTEVTLGNLKRYASAVAGYFATRKRAELDPNNPKLIEAVQTALAKASRMGAIARIPQEMVGSIMARVEANLRDHRIASYGLSDLITEKAASKTEKIDAAQAGKQEELDTTNKKTDDPVIESDEITAALNRYDAEDTAIRDIVDTYITDTDRVYMSSSIPDFTAKLINNIIKLFKFDKLEKPLLILTEDEIDAPVGQSGSGVFGQFRIDHPDAVILFLNLTQTSPAMVQLKYPKAYALMKRYQENNPKAAGQIFQSYIALHELGHLFTVYSLKSGLVSKADWDKFMVRYKKWYVQNSKDGAPWVRSFHPEFYHQTLSQTVMGPNRQKMNDEYFSKVGEFLAEDFARYFMFDKVPLAGRTNGFRQIAEKLRSAFNYMIAALKKEHNVDIRDLRPIFIKEMVDKVLEQSDMADDIWTRARGMEVKDIYRDLESHPLFTGEKLDALDYPSEPVQLTIPGLEGIEDLKGSFWSHWIGRHQLSEVYKHPVVKAAYDIIRGSQETVDRNFKRLWQGYVVFDPTAGIHLVRKVTDNSVDAVMKRSSENDFYAVLEVFQKGRDAKLHYNQTKQAYGHTLTPKQQELFDTLSNYFKNLHKTIVKMQDEMGIPRDRQLPYTIGWFPAVRQGRYHVRLRDVNGHTVRFQSFNSRKQAKEFIDNVKNHPQTKHFLNDGIEEVDYTDGFSAAEFLLDRINQDSRINPADKQTIDDIANKLFNKPKGYRKHYEHRGDVPGYMGNELFKSSYQLGKDFKRAIISNHKEFRQASINMHLDRKLNNLTGPNSIIVDAMPNVHRIVQTMHMMSTNRVKNVFAPGFEQKVNELFADLLSKGANAAGAALDKIPSSTIKPIAKHLQEYYPTRPALQQTHGYIARMFYILALTTRPSFWIAQAMTAPTSVRHMFKYDDGATANTFDAIAAMASGTARLFGMYRDPEFMKAMHRVAQDSDSFHPQFLNEFSPYSERTEKIIELVSGEMISAKADSFSRYWTFSMMYSFYKQKGMKGKALERKAREATDKTMILYTRQDRGKWVEKGGMATEAMAPLTTFMIGQYGNLLSDFKEFASRPGAKTMMPLVATGLITMALTGAVGLPFIMEYEFIRKQIQESNPDIKLPSIVEWVAGSNQFMEFGAMGLSGFDFGSGLRWNPLLNIMSEYGNADMGILSAFPGVNFAVDQANRFATVFQNDVLNEFGTGRAIPEAEYRQAYLSFFPAIIGGIEDARKFNASDRAMVPNASGDGIVPQSHATPDMTGFEKWFAENKEQISTYLGTRTVEKAKQDRVHRIMMYENEQRKAQIGAAAKVLVDGIISGDSGSISFALQRLTEMRVPPERVQEAVKTEYTKRITEQSMRDTTGTSGNVTPDKGRKYLRQEELQYGEEQ